MLKVKHQIDSTNRDAHSGCHHRDLSTVFFVARKIAELTSSGRTPPVLTIMENYVPGVMRTLNTLSLVLLRQETHTAPLATRVPPWCH